MHVSLWHIIKQIKETGRGGGTVRCLDAAALDQLVGYQCHAVEL